jgi:hypothetical protein
MTFWSDHRTLAFCRDSRAAYHNDYLRDPGSPRRHETMVPRRQTCHR